MCRRWRAAVALTLFVGVVGGISLALVQGARRSATVVDRYFAQARPYDLGLVAPTLTRAQVRRLPGVRRADVIAYVAMVSRSLDGQPQAGINGNAVNFDAADPTTRVLAGRIPTDPSSPEIVVDEDFVREFGKSVGDTVPVQLFGLDQLDEVTNGVYHPHGPHYRLPIAAVVRMTQDIGLDDVKSVSTSGYGSRNQVLIPERWYEAHKREFLDFGEVHDVQLDQSPGARSRLTGAVKGIARTIRSAPLRPEIIPPTRSSARRDALADPVSTETTALLALGVGIALVGAIATLLLLRNEQRLHDADGPVLRGLGCTNGQIGRASAVRVVPVAFGGACIAAGVAVALSARFPIGIGRELELSPGVEPNLAVIGVGAAAIGALVLGGATLLGRVATTHTGETGRVNGLSHWFARIGAPLGITLGSHLAFQRGRGVRSTAARSTVIAGAVALTIVSALGVYVAGIDHVRDDGAAHGWPWAVAIGNTNFDLSARTERRLGSDPRLTHRTTAVLGAATVDGHATEVIAFDPGGTAPPTVVSGRVPRADGEIALGRGLLEDLGAHVGDTVTVAFSQPHNAPPTKPRRLTVVGVAAPPALGETNQDRMGLVPFGAVTASGGVAPHQLVLADVGGPDRRATLAALRRDYSEEMATDIIPARVNNLARVRRLPVVGLLLAGAMGTFLLVYSLAVTARVRRRELAILRTLGLAGGGVRRVLAGQGVVLAGLMLLVGVPLGLVLGNALWRRVVTGIGLAPELTLPIAVVVLVPAALAVAILASILPARRAVRDPVAVPLRSE